MGEYFTKAKPFFVSNDTKVFPSTNILYGPWNSINEFKDWYESKTSSSIPNGTEIGVIQSDNTVKKYTYNIDVNSVETWYTPEDAVKANVKLSELENDAHFTSNLGTVTGIKMNDYFIPLNNVGIVDLGAVITDVSTKQDILESGVNIKTINGYSVLGSGNISITGSGEGSGDVNVIEEIRVNGTPQQVEDKVAYITITLPTKVSDLTNDSGFTSNTGTITRIKTVAGAHTAVDSSSGEVTLNIPTRVSHLTDSSNYVTISALSNGLNGKQDVISNLTTIENNAALGATALQPDAAAATYQPIGNYLTEHQSLSNYYIKSEVDTIIAGLVERIEALENADSEDEGGEGGGTIIPLEVTAAASDFSTSRLDDFNNLTVESETLYAVVI